MYKKIIFFLFFTNIIFGASVSNIASPAIIEEGFFITDKSWINFRLGYELYQAWDLLLEFEDINIKQIFSISNVKTFANSASFTINVKERLDAYVYLGSIQIEPEIKRAQTFLYKAKSDEGFYFKTGAKLVVFEIKDFTLGVDGKFSMFKAKNDYLLLNNTPIDERSLSYKFFEWQVAVGLGQKIFMFQPYIGITCKDTRLYFRNAPFYNNETLVSKFIKKTGGVLGTGASLGSFVMLNAELRFTNERSFSISAEARF